MTPAGINKGRILEWTTVLASAPAISCHRTIAFVLTLIAHGLLESALIIRAMVAYNREGKQCSYLTTRACYTLTNQPIVLPTLSTRPNVSDGYRVFRCCAWEGNRNGCAVLLSSRRSFLTNLCSISRTLRRYTYIFHEVQQTVSFLRLIDHFIQTHNDVLKMFKQKPSLH